MRRANLMKLALVAAVLPLMLPLSAEAQRRGRTDGPPGSHIGAGGYEPSGFHRYSLEFQFGAAVSERPPLSGRETGPPLSLGAVMSFWGDDWIRMDVAGHYLLNNGHLELLVGPRFQSGFWPVSASAGLKAGLIWIPEVGPRFGVSPQVGAEVLVGDRILLGIGYALDIPIGEPAVTHRPYMNVGYRF